MQAQAAQNDQYKMFRKERRQRIEQERELKGYQRIRRANNSERGRL